MTYARARLGLGIFGVGSLVIIATLTLLFKIPQQYLANRSGFGGSELIQLASVIGLFMLWLMPLDFLGGYLLPKKFGKTEQRFQEWFTTYVAAAVSQAALFVVFGALILFSSRIFGAFGMAIAMTLAIFGCFVLRNRFLIRREEKSAKFSKKALDAIALIQSWQIYVPRTIFVDHQDIGFTGGIVGIGRYTKIVLPKAWLEFSREQLATAIARRAIAIESGSYTRGLLVSLAWNVCGFLLCSMLPNAGLSTVTELVTTLCGFTLWSFLGLLTLPTLSRNASLNIDRSLVHLGMPPELISRTASSIDQLQDDEPDRSALIETIFHPVPSVSSRSPEQPVRVLAAWNVARTTLFFSWACLGFLSRAVHCNVGRPELWTMLPTD